MIDGFTRFITNHNETIILLTIAGILIAIGVWVFLGVFRKPESTGPDLTQIEESLKRILSQTDGALVRAGTGGSADVEALRAELEQRKATIEELRAEVEKAGTKNAPEELLAKIKNLEAKLAEYEIIEDDIADLSHFKDENSRLKKELEALKKHGGPELVDAFADALEKQDSKPSPAKADVTVRPPPAPASAAPEAPESSVAPATPVAPAPTETAVESPEMMDAFNEPPVEAEPQRDILAEFAAAPDETPADPMAELGEIDTNKMLEELQGLDMNMDVGADALEASPDVDKMAEEAKSLKDGE